MQVVALRSRDPFGAVLEALRGQIRSGQLPPGEPLIVMDLARALGISATPVREGLAYLAGEGLIDLDEQGIDILPAGRLLVQAVCRLFDRYDAPPCAQAPAPG